MRYISYTLGATLFMLAVYYFFFSGVSVTSFTNYPPKNTTIVAFGDSLVQGVGATQGNDLFSQVSKKIGMPIINKGVSGNTTADALARIEEVRSENPGLVIVLLGGNDFLRQVPRAETFKNLRTIVRTLQKDGATVIICGVRGGIISDNFAEEYEAVADEFHTGYIPNVLKGLIGRDQYMFDGIHPNDAGYGIIAEKIAPLVKSLYNR